MEKIKINTKEAEFSLNPGCFWEKVDELEIITSENGVFANNRKVVDITFNGIQLRLYLSVEKGNESYYVLMECNTFGKKINLPFSLKEFHGILCEAFVLAK